MTILFVPSVFVGVKRILVYFNEPSFLSTRSTTTNTRYPLVYTDRALLLLLLLPQPKEEDRRKPNDRPQRDTLCVWNQMSVPRVGELVVGRQNRNETVAGEGLDDPQDRMASRVPDADTNGSLPKILTPVMTFLFEDFQHAVVQPDVIAIVAIVVVIVCVAFVPVIGKRLEDGLTHWAVELVLSAVMGQATAGNLIVSGHSRDLCVVDIAAQKEDRCRWQSFLPVAVTIATDVAVVCPQ